MADECKHAAGVRDVERRLVRGLGAAAASGAGADARARGGRADPARDADRHLGRYVRLLVLHNLTYLHQLTTQARAAISAGTFTSYSTAVLKGTDVDQPRNLAKSVTVE